MDFADHIDTNALRSVRGSGADRNMVGSLLRNQYTTGMNMRYLALCTLLYGCSLAPDIPAPLRDRVFAEIELVDRIEDSADALGYATCANGVCHIQIRRDAYPRCITHEVMHAFSDNWHAGRETAEFCEDWER